MSFTSFFIIVRLIRELKSM